MTSIYVFLKDLMDENGRLIQELEMLRNGFEKCAMEKIELQSAMKGNHEEFAVKSQIFEQEIVNIKKHREIEIQEMDNRLQKVSKLVCACSRDLWVSSCFFYYFVKLLIVQFYAT
jgi:translation initiation factor 6 (eIF-6)